MAGNVRVVEHFFGVKLGPFTDVFEIRIVTNRTAAIQCVTKWARSRGCKGIGRAYDGAYVFVFSDIHRLSFYWREDHIRFDDRHERLLTFRVFPSPLRRALIGPGSNRFF